jgi:hypothetical protein
VGEAGGVGNIVWSKGGRKCPRRSTEGLKDGYKYSGGEEMGLDWVDGPKGNPVNGACKREKRQQGIR